MKTITNLNSTFLHFFSTGRNWRWPAENKKVHGRVYRASRWVERRSETKEKQPPPPTHCPPYPQRWFSARNTDFNRFPFNNFTYYLTLFSKFFSSFPHGTCLLSVSCIYLALDEIYHPFWAAFPNNSTLRKCITMTCEFLAKNGIFTLYDTLFQRILAKIEVDKHFFKLQLDWSFLILHRF